MLAKNENLDENFEYDEIYGKINLLKTLSERMEEEIVEMKEYELFEKMHNCDGTFIKSNRTSL